MHKRKVNYSFIIIALILLIVVAFYLHLTNGMFDISIGEVFQTRYLI